MPENGAIYANSQLALTLFEVLEEMLGDEQVPEHLAYAMLAEVENVGKGSTTFNGYISWTYMHNNFGSWISHVYLWMLQDVYYHVAILKVLQEEIPAKAELKGSLDNYKYFDNVWRFEVRDLEFRLNPTGSGSMKKAQLITCDRLRLTSVDAKVALMEGGQPV